MKVLLSTNRNPAFDTITEYIERALKAEGHEVLFFNDGKRRLPGRIRNVLPALEKLDLALINRALEGEVHKFRPDVFLECGGERIHPDTVGRIRRLGILTTLWTIDPLRACDVRPARASAYDYVFCGGSEMIEALRGHSLIRAPVWLPFACEPTSQNRVDLSNQERRNCANEICFVGSLHAGLYPGRIRLLEALSDFKLAVYGPGAEDIPAGSPLKAHIRGGKTPPAVWTRLYSAADIVLCMHYHDPSGQVACYQASPRVFEALCCGTFLLVDRQPDVTALFEDGRHLVVFDDEKDLRDKAAFYLAHPRERAEIAAQGRELARSAHTYVERIRRLFSTLNGGQA
jgi:glycosyltransferase involved in cell wall biosynthesis